MNPEVERIFLAVSDLTSAEREAYYDANNINASLRREVDSLLDFDRGASQFLARELMQTASLHIEEAHEGQRFGAYVLLCVLGSGGMGTVYLAERADGEVRQRVAVKLLRQSALSDPVRIARFLRERQILASLNHPGIARLLDAGHQSPPTTGPGPTKPAGQPYLVMEYVEGETLDAYADGLSVEEKIQLVIKICEAVSYAHANLVVHRDLKPSNILVDYQGNPKLLDFGIAKILEEAEDRTQTLQRMFSPYYSSPEQIEDRPITAATDVYSLGAILYRLLTGRGPHDTSSTDQTAKAGSPAEYLDSIRQREANKLSSVVPALKGDLDLILAKALRKEPDQRYRTATDFAADLLAYIESRPISARKGEWTYRTTKFLRRYRIPVVAAVVFAITLIVAHLRVERQRAIAEYRFGLVRELSRRLLEVEERIRPLQGATSSRQFIAETSLRYLDQLASEPIDDKVLLLEIARGYDNVASVLYHRNSASVGKPEDGLKALSKAKKLLDDASRRFPGDLPILREVVDNQTEIVRTTTHGVGAEKAIPLTAELIRLKDQLKAQSNTLEDQQRIIAAYGVLQTVFVNAGRNAEARPFVEQEVEISKRVLESQPDSPKIRTNYANRLRTYGTFLRYEAELEEAARVLRESISVLNEVPEGIRKSMGLEIAYYYLGVVEGEPDSLSMGHLKEAADALGKSCEILRKVLKADPGDQNARLDFAMSGYKLGLVLTQIDPQGALRIFDEVAVEMSKSLDNSKHRQYRDMSMAEATFAMRRLGRSHAEIEAWLAAKKPREADLKRGMGTRGTRHAYYRAEAEQHVAARRFNKGIEIYRNMLAAFPKSHLRPNDDLADAWDVVVTKRRLAEILELAGQKEEAERLRNEYIETWRTWMKKRPGNAFVERQMAALTGHRT